MATCWVRRWVSAPEEGLHALTDHNGVHGAKQAARSTSHHTVAETRDHPGANGAAERFPLDNAFALTPTARAKQLSSLNIR